MSAVEDLEQERRITFCLYEHWEKLASDGNLPALKNMRREQIAPFKNNLTLLDLRENIDEPTFQVIGSALQEDLKEDLTHKPVNEVPRRTMLSRVVDHYREVLANRVPIAFEAEFVNSNGENALYRGILLPFSDDTENINFILGGVRWILEKDLTLDDTKPTIEELMKSIAAGKSDSAEIEDGIAATQDNDPEQMTEMETAEETGEAHEEFTADENNVVLDENHLPREEEEIIDEKDDHDIFVDHRYDDDNIVDEPFTGNSDEINEPFVDDNPDEDIIEPDVAAENTSSPLLKKEFLPEPEQLEPASEDTEQVLTEPTDPEHVASEIPDAISPSDPNAEMMPLDENLSDDDLIAESNVEEDHFEFATDAIETEASIEDTEQPHTLSSEDIKSFREIIEDQLDIEEQLEAAEKQPQEETDTDDEVSLVDSLELSRDDENLPLQDQQVLLDEQIDEISTSSEETELQDPFLEEIERFDTANEEAIESTVQDSSESDQSEVDEPASVIEADTVDSDVGEAEPAAPDHIPEATGQDEATVDMAPDAPAADSDDLSIEELMESIIAERKFDASYMREQKASQTFDSTPQTDDVIEENVIDEIGSEDTVHTEALDHSIDDIKTPDEYHDEAEAEQAESTAEPIKDIIETNELETLDNQQKIESGDNIIIEDPENTETGFGDTPPEFIIKEDVTSEPVDFSDDKPIYDDSEGLEPDANVEKAEHTEVAAEDETFSANETQSLQEPDDTEQEISAETDDEDFLILEEETDDDDLVSFVETLDDVSSNPSSEAIAIEEETETTASFEEQDVPDEVTNKEAEESNSLSDTDTATDQAVAEEPVIQQRETIVKEPKRGTVIERAMAFINPNFGKKIEDRQEPAFTKGTAKPEEQATIPSDDVYPGKLEPVENTVSKQSSDLDVQEQKNTPDETSETEEIDMMAVPDDIVQSEEPVERKEDIEITSSETDESPELIQDQTEADTAEDDKENDNAEIIETDEQLSGTPEEEEETANEFDEASEKQNEEEAGESEAAIEVTEDDIFMGSSESAPFDEEIVSELTSTIKEKSAEPQPEHQNAEAEEEKNEPHIADSKIPDEKPLTKAEVQEDLEDELTLATLKSTLKQVVGYINKEDANHNRSRDSLYNILTAIYEFHATCETSPNAYAELVKEHDLKIQSRAPFTPILKICLGKDYDKTRLTEYAAALGIARYMNIDIDEFHAFIKNFPGGIKGCVKEMRVIRKHGASGNITARKTRSIEEAREILREMAPIASFRLKKVIVGNNIDEFCLLLAKRDGHDINVLKILDNNYTKLDPVLKRAAFIKGNLNNGRK